MVKKVCPFCGKTSYSAANEYKWICPHCHNDISHVKAQAINVAENELRPDTPKPES